MARKGLGAERTRFPTPAQAAFGYLLLGLLWILVSDNLLVRHLGEAGVLGDWAMLKGMVFIGLSATVIYGLLARQRRVATSLLTRTPARPLAPPAESFSTGDTFDPQTDWMAELVQATPEGIGIFDVEGWAVYLNPAGRRLLGVGEEQFVEGLHSSRFYSETAWQDILDRVWPEVCREGLWKGEMELVTMRGEPVPVYQVLIAHRDKRGRITHYSTHAHDLREVASQKRNLRQAADILDNTAEGVAVVDRAGRIEWVNPAFSRILEYEADELLGRSPGELGETGLDHESFQRLCADAHESDGWQGEVALRRRNGEIFPAHMSISPFRDPSGRLANFSIIFSDLTHFKHFESQLSFLANHDPLTGLANGARFQADLGVALNALGEGQQLCLLLLDLYDFKMINESLGRASGDEVLVEVARRLDKLESENCRVARLSGDEFGIYIVGTGKEISPALEAERIRDIFGRPFTIEGSDLFLGGSIGIVLAPEDGLDVQTLIRNAEIGVKRARAQGQNTYKFYSDQLQARSTESILVTSGLRRAIHDEAFELHYQPILCLADGRARGVEALVRWSHPELGTIPPDRFIAVAERTGLIHALGEIVLRQACRDFSSLLAQRSDFHLAINVSPAQIEPEVFPALMREVVLEAGIRPAQVELEITESLMMQDSEEAESVIRDLIGQGFHISIDDFGTGFSSLSLLKRFPAHCLKIDKSFTNRVPGKADDETMARAIIAMAKGFGMATVAEGIETESQLEFLIAEGCEFGQGYYFSRPLPLDDVMTVLDS